MAKHTSFLQIFAIAITFLLLEGVCVLLISKNSILQQTQLVLRLRQIQQIGWQRVERRRYANELESINEILFRENQQLLAQNQQLLELVSEQQYRDSAQMLEVQNRFQYIPAEVIRNETNRQHNVIFLNKGRADGVRPDMGVVTTRGIIGFVNGVSEHFCQVVSLLDIDRGITGTLAKSNTFGPVRWDGVRYNQVIMDEIPIHTTYAIGDTVVSSGYSQLFPKNIPIGTVASHKLIDGVSHRLYLDLFEDFRSLHFVYIVYNNQETEIESL